MVISSSRTKRPGVQSRSSRTLDDRNADPGSRSAASQQTSAALAERASSTRLAISDHPNATIRVGACFMGTTHHASSAWLPIGARNGNTTVLVCFGVLRFAAFPASAGRDC